MNRYGRQLLRFALCALILLASGVGRAATVGDIRLELRTDVVVSGNRIVLSDLVAIDSADNQLTDTVAAIRVGNVPRVGYVERYTREDLEQLIRSRLLPYTGKIEWQGAKAIKVRSATQILTGDKLTNQVAAVVQTELEKDYQSANLNPSLTLADIELPIGDVSWKIRPIDASHLLPILPVWVDVFVDKQPYRAVLISFSLHLKQAVYVARRDLQAGAMMSPDDLETKVEDISDAVQEILPTQNITMPARLKKPIKRGQILMRDQLAAQGMVFRGDSVKLTLADAGLAIETRAVAQQDGDLGQFIKVLPDASTAAVTALIVAPGVVKMEGR